MLGFTPFKRHANKFNYIPRFYDPEKDARDQRRAELRGERAEDDAREYRPGQYIRTQREARAAHRATRDNKGRMQVWKMVGGAVLVLLFIYLLFPRLAEVFITAQRTHAKTEAMTPEAVAPRNSFDQSHVSDVDWQEQSIEVVPNDYKE